MRLRSAAFATLLLVCAGEAAHGQGVPVRKLGAPVATYDHEFTTVDGVRELKDGRVIVLDKREKAIQVIDLKTKSAKKIGREGDGPGEYRLPLQLFSLGGDSSLVLDMARYGKMPTVSTPPPFFTVEQWAVSRDGRVAVVTPEPYRVTLVNAAGVRVQGPVIPVIAIAVTDAEKAAYRVEMQQPVATISFAPGGAQTTSYGKPSYEEPEEWPDVLPAFSKKAVAFATDGMLWVQRSTRAGAPALYDVFDPAAKLAYQLELPAKRKVVGFGNGTVYVARVDDSDLHYLERYRLPIK